MDSDRTNKNYLLLGDEQILGKNIKGFEPGSNEYIDFSEMDSDFGRLEGPGDWALRISEALGVKEYVNPPGGVDIFDPEKFKAAGIKLTISDTPPFEYSTKGYEFIPNLSIIDVMMFNSKERIGEYLHHHYSLI